MEVTSRPCNSEALCFCSSQSQNLSVLAGARVARGERGARAARVLALQLAPLSPSAARADEGRCFPAGEATSPGLGLLFFGSPRSCDRNASVWFSCSDFWTRDFQAGVSVTDRQTNKGGQSWCPTINEVECVWASKIKRTHLRLRSPPLCSFLLFFVPAAATLQARL